MTSKSLKNMSLPAEQVAYLDRLVSSGRYRSRDEALSAAVSLLQADEVDAEFLNDPQFIADTLETINKLKSGEMKTIQVQRDFT